MPTDHTIQLLKQCHVGVQMAISSIDEILDKIYDQQFKNFFLDTQQQHEELDKQILESLTQYHQHPVQTNIILKGVSWIQTNLRMAMDGSDATIANLMTDGCNMGIKSLSKYLNEYTTADEHSRAICHQIIDSEDQLLKNIRCYL